MILVTLPELRLGCFKLASLIILTLLIMMRPYGKEKWHMFCLQLRVF